MAPESLLVSASEQIRKHDAGRKLADRFTRGAGKEQILADGLLLGMNWRLVSARHGAERSAALVHKQMTRGLCGLATVAATAP